MKIATILAASILSLAALDTQAAAPADIPSISVQFADLNLDSQAGLTSLYRRLRNAAEQVCKEQAGERLMAKRTYAVCIELALSTAVARVDRPTFSDYATRLSGKPMKGASERVAGR